MSITCWVPSGSLSITVAAGTAKGGTLRAWAHACGSSSTREEHNTDAERLEDELRKINRSLRAQTLRLEEHEDPNHPIVALASERIVELSTRKAAVTDALETFKAKRPAGHHPDEILAMLDALPDLRQTIKKATEEELAEIFRAFDVEITYDKDRQVLNLAATITPELLPDPANESDRPESDRPESDRPNMWYAA